MSNDGSRIGEWGEGIAAAYLEDRGYTLLTRNYHTSQGEIDIVALSPSASLPCLVFVEVKTRTSHSYGYPEEAVTRKKWDHLQTAIQWYFESHPAQSLDWRVDVIAVLGHPDQEKPQIEHYINVVMIDDRN